MLLCFAPCINLNLQRRMTSRSKKLFQQPSFRASHTKLDLPLPLPCRFLAVQRKFRSTSGASSPPLKFTRGTGLLSIEYVYREFYEEKPVTFSGRLLLQPSLRIIILQYTKVSHSIYMAKTLQ
ncbi:hypothetical protein CEXT_401381 [Caerostris extrusa]|uniref:Uncharacterized protein n=1 Tax=Caerostris extrusa TaxID=172846 RepID=A0AAV4PNL3_CAEEX|nr:hypothetical protein CEXT_401381 [Caerostris extrusa]